MNCIKHILLFFLTKISRSEFPDFLFRLVSDHPDRDNLPNDKILVVGGKGYQKWAYLKCPCGCGNFIMLSLSKNTRPGWSITVDFFNRPTVYPSIRQTSGCKSHFWVKKGHINWCADSGKTYHLSSL